MLTQLSLYTCRSVDNWGIVHGWAIKQTVHDFLFMKRNNRSDILPSLTPSQMLLIHVDQSIVLAALDQHHRHHRLLRKSTSSSRVIFSFHRAFSWGIFRLRLGYLSYSFGSGTRNGLLTEVLGKHLGRRFEVFAYALRPHDASDDKIKRQTIERNFEHWVDVSRFSSFSDISQRINDDGVQVLVDLCGLHSNGTNIYAVFEGNPAPVQVMCHSLTALWFHSITVHDVFIF